MYFVDLWVLHVRVLILIRTFKVYLLCFTTVQKSLLKTLCWFFIFADALIWSRALGSKHFRGFNHLTSDN